MSVPESYLAGFDVPPELRPYLGYFMEDRDWRFFEAADENGVIPEGAFLREELREAFRGGILDRVGRGTPDVYRTGRLYERIECIVRGDYGRWERLPQEVKGAVIDYMQSLERWVLPYRREGVNLGVIRPFLLEEAVDFIRRSDRRFYLQQCDCRLLHENCRHLVDVCLHFEEDVTNTNLDRGYGRLLSKEEAVQVMIDADRDGLIHNFEANSFCNCCGEACWAVRQIGTYRGYGYDPYRELIDARYLAKIGETCISCGACARRCPIPGAIFFGNGTASVDPSHCIGCGVCRGACGRGAISMVPRET